MVIRYQSDPAVKITNTKTGDSVIVSRSKDRNHAIALKHLRGRHWVKINLGIDPTKIVASYETEHEPFEYPWHETETYRDSKLP
jgi:hypothetical protein